MNQNCISHWLPILQAAGIPVPKTVILQVQDGNDLVSILDGVLPPGWESLMASIHAAVLEVGGYPAFLRTGQTSNKHDWKNSCFLANKDAIGSHVANLVEFSHMCDIMGLAHDVFAVREFLDLDTAFTSFADFPVNRERRAFIRDHKLLCLHPYWPEGAVAKGRPEDVDWKKKLATLNTDSADDVRELTALIDMAAAAFDGFWSVDFAKTADGRWLCIDMADGEQSFHWLECPFCPESMRQMYGED